MSEHMKEKGYNKRVKRNAKKKAEKKVREYERKIETAKNRHGHGVKKKHFTYAMNKTQNARLNRVSDLPAFERIYNGKSLKGWNPKTKSPRGILISLVKHYHVTYSVPGFLYNAYVDENYLNRDLALFSFHHLTKGGKPKNLLGTAIDAPLTKKMLHLFLNSNQPTFARAIREAQFKSQDSDPRIFQAFMMARPQIYERRVEKRYAEVINWLSKIGLLETSLVGPMLDFFDYQYDEDPHYNLKGRTINSVMNAVRKWHKELHTKNISGPKEYPILEGVNSFFYEKKKGKGESQYAIAVWTISPILTPRELQKEGGSLSHCVAGYSHRMANGSSFIWSVKENSSRKVTVEVNGRKEIIQARGKFNRVPTEAEKSIIKRWAKVNQLRLKLHYW